MSKHEPDFLGGEDWSKRNPARKALQRSPAPARKRRSFSLFLASLLLAGIGLAATPAFRTNGIQFGAHDNTQYVGAFGCKADGVADDTTCLTSAAAALVAGNTLVLPAGRYLLTDTVVFTKDNIHIVGAGVKSTTIVFNPASAKPAFKVDNGGAVDRVYGFTATGIDFTSTDTTHQKIAIDLVDTSGAEVSDIWCGDGSSSAPPWRGANSICLRLRGREFTNIHDVRLWADSPVVVDVDPYISAPVSCDHFHLSGSYLLSTPGGSNKIFTINDSIIVSNFKIDGDNAWIVDKYGLYWVETGGTSVSAFSINIGDIRFEQATDLTGYSIYIDHTKGIQNIAFNNLYMASGQNGLNLGNTNIVEASISNSIFPTNDVTKKHLNISGGVKDLRFSNVQWQVNTTATLTGLTLLWAMPQLQSAAVLPPTAWYADSTTATTVAQSLGANATLLANVFKNTSAANTNAITFDTTNTFTGSNHLFELKNAGTSELFVDSGGTVASLNGKFDTQGNVQEIIGGNNASSVALGRSGASGVFISAPLIGPGSTTQTSGSSSFPWPATWSKRLIQPSQNLSFSATPAFDCTAGGLVHIGTITGNVTGPTMVAGSAGEVCTIVFLKDATAGTYTINGWGANTRTAGVMTFTATASTVFEITFRWDDRLGTPQWVEQSRVGPI